VGLQLALLLVGGIEHNIHCAAYAHAETGGFGEFDLQLIISIDLI